MDAVLTGSVFTSDQRAAPVGATGAVLGTTELAAGAVGTAEDGAPEGVWVFDGVVGAAGVVAAPGAPDDGPPSPIESSTCLGSMVAVGSGVVLGLSGAIGVPVAGDGVPTIRGRRLGSTIIRAGFCAGTMPNCAAL